MLTHFHSDFERCNGIDDNLYDKPFEFPTNNFMTYILAGKIDNTFIQTDCIIGKGNDSYFGNKLLKFQTIHNTFHSCIENAYFNNALSYLDADKLYKKHDN